VDEALLIAETRHEDPSLVSEHTYRPAWWVPGGHAQTLWAKFFRRRRPLHARRERWTTPDGDFLDLYRRDAQPDAPRLLLLHGLEGTVRSHYVTGFFAEATRRGWGADLLIFRGCGDQPNTAPRFYHSGETTDLSFVVDRIREEFPGAPLLLTGVSLGGNVLLKFLGEAGERATEYAAAAAAISVPFDLERGARKIGRGFSRIYDRHFLRSLRRKAVEKLSAYPDLFDGDALGRARSIYDFDDAVTAPVHGFADAHDYYSRSSSLGFLDRIRVPSLLLSAIDDPFLPAAVLDEVRSIASDNQSLELEFTAHGGHVGFVAGHLPWRPFYYAEWRACEFLAARLGAFRSNPFPSVL
jgi:predicted alpha/beta-fold hydrolase